MLHTGNIAEANKIDNCGRYALVINNPISDYLIIMVASLTKYKWYGRT